MLSGLPPDDCQTLLFIKKILVAHILFVLKQEAQEAAS